MKKLITILFVLLSGVVTQANNSINTVNTLIRGYDGNAFIFREGNVEFSVFPDGQFDFVYLGPKKTKQVVIDSQGMSISFNSGYNYDALVQYDMYGAVIQVEHVPIHYDHYGRIVQAGETYIRYKNNRLVQIGGLYLHYHGTQYSHHTGYINVYNRRYVYRPWHVHYVRPIYTRVIVYHHPYRINYHPVRYPYADHVTYYNNRGRSNYANGRREFYKPGTQTHLRDGRMVQNTSYDPNQKNLMIADGGRNNQNAPAQATNSSSGRNNAITRQNVETGRNNTSVNSKTNENTIIRSNSTGRNNLNNSVTPPARNNTIAPSSRVNVKSAPQSNSRINTNSRVQDTRKTAPAIRNTSGSSRNNAAVKSAPGTTTVKKDVTRTNSSNPTTRGTATNAIRGRI